MSARTLRPATIAAARDAAARARQKAARPHTGLMPASPWPRSAPVLRYRHQLDLLHLLDRVMAGDVAARALPPEKA